MITPSFSPTATERVLPKLALDFTTGVLDSRITFTRTNAIATRYNASGYIETIGANIPRFDYDPVSLVCKGLLIEESRTNLLKYNQTFDTASTSWADGNVTRGTSTTSPDGTSNAILFIPTAVNGNHYIYTNTFTNRNRAANTTYSLSVYVKASGYNYVTLSLCGTNSGNYAAVTFQLTDSGSVTQTNVGTGGTLTSYGISSIGNGWYRIYIVGKSTQANGYDFCGFGPNATFTPGIYGMPTYTGDGISGGYIWGMQDEAGDFPTSYIPTTTGIVTRSADVAVMTGTNFSNWYNQTAGTFTASFITNFRPSYPLFVLAASDNTSTNRTQIYADATSIGGYTTGGSGDANPTVANTTTASSVNTAYGVGTNNTNIAVNTTLGTNDTSVTAPTTLNRLYLGSNFNGGGNYLNGNLQKVAFYPQRLTSPELQAFSK